MRYSDHELSKLIEEAEELVRSAPDGNLPLPMRKRIWAKIAKLSGTKSGRKRLTELDRLAVTRVLNIWSQVFPTDEGARQMLQLAQQVVDGRIDEDTAERSYGSFYVDVVDNRKYKPDQYPAMFVGHAAANTVMTALSEVDLSHEKEGEQDEDRDPESYEPSYLAAAAYSGGLRGQGNPAKRREFWLWYLRDAINDAMNS